jgi:hypothetical protein
VSPFEVGEPLRVGRQARRERQRGDTSAAGVVVDGVLAREHRAEGEDVHRPVDQRAEPLRERRRAGAAPRVRPRAAAEQLSRFPAQLLAAAVEIGDLAAIDRDQSRVGKIEQCMKLGLHDQSQRTAVAPPQPGQCRQEADEITQRPRKEHQCPIHQPSPSARRAKREAPAPQTHSS